jgi:hypothetical protein
MNSKSFHCEISLLTNYHISHISWNFKLILLEFFSKISNYTKDQCSKIFWVPPTWNITKQWYLMAIRQRNVITNYLTHDYQVDTSSFCFIVLPANNLLQTRIRNKSLRIPIHLASLKSCLNTTLFHIHSWHLSVPNWFSQVTPRTLRYMSCSRWRMGQKIIQISFIG